MLRTIKECPKPNWSGSAPTKVTTMGKFLEVTTMGAKSLGPPCVKLDKDHYQDIRTGEVKDITHAESRADDFKSVRRSLAHIRALVNTNVTDPTSCRWVTLTYKENMTDTKRLYEDYRRFWQRFCYWCKANGYPRPEYITVQEPQGRGAWHIHAFFIWPGSKAPYISNDTMRSLWGQGFTKTKALQDVDNVGAYFSAYLGDMPLDEFQELPQEQQEQLEVMEIQTKDFKDAKDTLKTKRFVKGGRLPLYPVGMNIVRKTKGIKEPLVEHMTYSEAQKKASSAKLTFSRSFVVADDLGQTINKLSKDYYTMPNC